jgi:hypothetical protein
MPRWPWPLVAEWRLACYFPSINFSIRHSDTELPGQLLAPGTATSVPGGAIIPLDMLRDMACLPNAPQPIVDLAEVLGEEENRFAMAILSERVTGIRRRPRWCWSIKTSPYPAPPPHHGVTKTLGAAKPGFKTRYEEIKRMGVRPFS